MISKAEERRPEARTVDRMKTFVRYASLPVRGGGEGGGGRGVIGGEDINERQGPFLMTPGGGFQPKAPKQATGWRPPPRTDKILSPKR